MAVEKKARTKRSKDATASVKMDNKPRLVRKNRK